MSSPMLSPRSENSETESEDWNLPLWISRLRRLETQNDEAEAGHSDMPQPSNTVASDASQNNSISLTNLPQPGISLVVPASSGIASDFVLTTTNPRKRKRERDTHPRHQDDWTDVSTPDDDLTISETTDSNPPPEKSNAPPLPDPPDDDILSAKEGVYPPDNTAIETVFPLARDVAVPAIMRAPPSLLTTDMLFPQHPPRHWTPDQAEEVAWWMADGLQCMIEMGESAGREIRRVEPGGPSQAQGADGKVRTVRPVAYVTYTWETRVDAAVHMNRAITAEDMATEEGGRELTAEGMGAPSVMDFGGWLRMGLTLNRQRMKVYWGEEFVEGTVFCRILQLFVRPDC
ncbi:uncharacterized protein B0T15DRAFT_310894 [Chaetomium strumarium]|uniref:Uncharacterized protein n=1 Tax=Chaetomium strumarium TaxID=1170767 RepID=A0AAJ0GME1_9PEZI|nr:hypothetical protein B0T15DRAFT_310894 [Chaetomium strumarium]